MPPALLMRSTAICSPTSAVLPTGGAGAGQWLDAADLVGLGCRQREAQRQRRHHRGAERARSSPMTRRRVGLPVSRSCAILNLPAPAFPLPCSMLTAPRAVKHGALPASLEAQSCQSRSRHARRKPGAANCLGSLDRGWRNNNIGRAAGLHPLDPCLLMTDPALKHGLRFADLYDREGLVRLDRAFVADLAAADAALHDRLMAGRPTPTGSAARPSPSCSSIWRPISRIFSAPCSASRANCANCRRGTTSWRRSIR